ncbi:T-cell ecto-ADP-ribosyltransferase 2-like [Hipposideros larvatus]
MTSLLAIEVHCLIVTQWLTQQVTGVARLTKSVPLDMADDALDDQYLGCTEEMDTKAPQVLKEELKLNSNFKIQWELAKKRWKQVNKKSYPKEFNDFHGIAIMAYTGERIHKELNEAVRKYRQNQKNFQFKAFHYYLTRALQLLHTGKCHTVYRGTPRKYSYSKGNVRFGQFASSSKKKSVAVKFAGKMGTVFTIKTCSGVDIEQLSFYRDESEILIPVYEEFQKVTKLSSNEEYDEFLLENPKTSMSIINCNKSSNFNSSGMTGSPAFLLLLPGLLVLLFLPAEM